MAPLRETVGPHAQPDRAVVTRKMTVQTVQTVQTVRLALTVSSDQSGPPRPRAVALMRNQTGAMRLSDPHVARKPTAPCNRLPARSTRRASHQRPFASVPKTLRMTPRMAPA